MRAYLVRYRFQFLLPYDFRFPFNSPRFCLTVRWCPIRDTCRLPAVHTALHVLTSSKSPSVALYVLNLRFSVDSIPSALTSFSIICRS
jgi:hypothetical protein